MKWILIISAGLLTVCLIQLDRRFFKQNDGFCIRTILGQVPHEADGGIPLSEDLHKTLSQPFHYLAKGHQSYVFSSADGNYVIKCYRFPSHLRVFPWLNHPISYFLGQKRQEIMNYNEEKLNLSFSSYKLAFEQLREETGTEWIHLNRTTALQTKIHLIDQTGNHYHVPLNALTLVVQKRFVMLFEALETMQTQEQMRELITSLVATISHLWNQGIIDQDPVLSKNYGWDGNRVVYVDIGRFAKRTDNDLTLRSYIEQITPILADWLAQNDPELLAYYRTLLDNLS